MILCIWVDVVIDCNFFDRATFSLTQARELSHLTKRASQCEVSFLRPFCKALHIESRQYVMIDGILIFESSIQCCRVDLELAAPILFRLQSRLLSGFVEAHFNHRWRLTLLVRRHYIYQIKSIIISGPQI